MAFCQGRTQTIKLIEGVRNEFESVACHEQKIAKCGVISKDFERLVSEDNSTIANKLISFTELVEKFLFIC